MTAPASTLTNRSTGLAWLGTIPAALTDTIADLVLADFHLELTIYPTDPTQVEEGVVDVQYHLPISAEDQRAVTFFIRGAVAAIAAR